MCTNLYSFYNIQQSSLKKIYLFRLVKTCKATYKKSSNPIYKIASSSLHARTASPPPPQSVSTKEAEKRRCRCKDTREKQRSAHRIQSSVKPAGRRIIRTSDCSCSRGSRGSGRPSTTGSRSRPSCKSYACSHLWAREKQRPRLVEYFQRPNEGGKMFRV